MPVTRMTELVGATPTTKPPGAKRPKKAKRKGGGGETDLSRFQRNMLAAFPPGSRNAERLGRLWREVYRAGVAVRIRWAKEKGSVSNKAEVARLDEEWRRWQVRMDNYGLILKMRPEHQGNLDMGVVRGFLLSYPGAGHIADSLFPLTFARQADILVEHEHERLRLLVLDLKREWQVIKDEGHKLVEHITPLAVAVAATVTGGLILYAMTGRRLRR